MFFLALVWDGDRIVKASSQRTDGACPRGSCSRSGKRDQAVDLCLYLYPPLGGLYGAERPQIIGALLRHRGCIGAVMCDEELCATPDLETCRARDEHAAAHDDVVRKEPPCAEEGYLSNISPQPRLRIN